MRIQPVNGNLPAVARPVVEVALLDPSPLASAPLAVAAAAAPAGSSTSEGRQRPPMPAKVFDPPLIAQRAALGLPVGGLVLDYAREQGISYNAAWAAVNLVMPADSSGAAD